MNAVRAAFTALVGRPPVGVWAAPGRVNLIGEHTDYNDGFVLPLALQRQVAVAAAPAAGPRSRVWSRQQPGGPVGFSATAAGPGDVVGWAAYAAGVCWALRTAGHRVPELDLVLDGDVPLGAGLSSSAAVGCAVALAVTEIGGASLPPTELALCAQRAENGFVGAPTGVMDQMVAVHGRRGHLLHLDTRTLAVEHVPFDPAAHGLALLVVDTRAPHALVDGRYADRRSACEAAAAALGVPALRDARPAEVATLADALLRRRARHVVGENRRVAEVVGLLRDGGDPRPIGPLLTASHASLRDDFEVTVAHLDVAVEATLSAGAHGARMTGGGFGGCVLALVEAAAVDAAVDAVERAYGARGWAPPSAFVAVPAGGAARIG